MVLRAENLCLRLPENGPVIFDDISFEIHGGDIACLTGPPRSGKTMLGLALCGYLPLWAGSWTLEGTIELLSGPVVQGTGYSGAGVILENPYTQLSGLKRTVYHEIAFPLECRGAGPETLSPRIERFANLFGVSHLLDRNIRTLSGGELQRVLFAGAFITAPHFLYLDRPFTEIDEEFRPELMRIIRSLTEESDSAVLISEDSWLLPGQQFDCEIHLGTENDDVETDLTALPVNTQKCYPVSLEPILEVENLSFLYDEENPVLSNLSFSIGSGDIAILSGPNGAGKTTLAKLITGILTPSVGRIILDGRDITSMEEWEIMATVGLSLQDPGLHLCRKTVGEELELAGKWGNAPGKFIELLGLVPLTDSHPLELSQAEKKMLGLALACGDKRRVLILDEPTQYQDTKGFKRMTEAIRVHTEEGRAVIIITHDPRVFRAFPDAGIVQLS